MRPQTSLCSDALQLIETLLQVTLLFIESVYLFHKDLQSRLRILAAIFQRLDILIELERVYSITRYQLSLFPYLILPRRGLPTMRIPTQKGRPCVIQPVELGVTRREGMALPMLLDHQRRARLAYVLDHAGQVGALLAQEGVGWEWRRWWRAE